MTDEGPFRLLIKVELGGLEQVSCGQLLRVVSNNRVVYEGQWGKKEVVVKLFSGWVRGPVRFEREYRGLKGLAGRGLNCPEVYFTGRTEDGRCAIVMERIADSVDVNEYVRKTADREARRQLGRLLCGELARVHSKGVVQEDLNLGNFRMGGGKIYMLDTNKIRFCRGEAGRKKSIRQLCSILRALRIYDAASVEELAGVYRRVRGWEREELDTSYLRGQMAELGRRNMAKRLKIWLERRTRHTKIGDREVWFGAFDRVYFERVRPEDLVSVIDSLVGGGKAIVNGRTTYAEAVQWNDTTVAVIRLEHKGFVQLLSDSTGTFQNRCCRLGRSLWGISEPIALKALAYLERREGGVIKSSYFIAEVRS